MTKKAIIKKKLSKITISQEISGKEGSFGVYVQISSKLGIKIVGGTSVEKHFKEYLKEAIHEARNLREARKRVSFVPRCYGVQSFKIDGKSRIGILMQHLGKKRLENMNINNDYDVRHCLKNRLLKVNILHDDLHNANVMFYKGRYYVIDFGQVTIIKSQ
jgi:tRNA A-37 threonylcarbamoyl transferase component Bud32